MFYDTAPHSIRDHGQRSQSRMLFFGMPMLHRPALKAGKFLVIAPGTKEEVAKARDILGKTGASGVTAHQG